MILSENRLPLFRIMRVLRFRHLPGSHGVQGACQRMAGEVLEFYGLITAGLVEITYV